MFEKFGRVFSSEMPLIANLFQLESSIQKHAGSKGAVVGGEAPLKKKILIFNPGFLSQLVSRSKPRKFNRDWYKLLYSETTQLLSELCGVY